MDGEGKKVTFANILDHTIRFYARLLKDLVSVFLICPNLKKNLRTIYKISSYIFFFLHVLRKTSLGVPEGITKKQKKRNFFLLTVSLKKIFFCFLMTKKKIKKKINNIKFVC